MSRITEKAYAKLNICLAVGERLKNGYHAVESLMQTVSLYDTLSLEKGEVIRLTCIGQELSSGEDNLAHRAAQAFFAHSGIKGGVDIVLEKRIPQGAGLGGGSADAAAVLRGLNRLYGTGYGKETLAAIGAPLGADVPFCVLGGTMLATGIGDVLTPLAHRELYYVLLFGKEQLSTPGMYKALDGGENTYPTAQLFLAEWEKEGFFGAGNSFLPIASALDPTVEEHIEQLKELGCAHASISGKGPTVFGVFFHREDAERAASALGGVFAKSVMIE